MDPRFAELQASLERRPGRSLNLPGLVLRESAVLVPLFLRAGVPHLLFTKRPSTLRTHAGQISFPGGRRDREDPTPLHTALRETEEELGIDRTGIQVLGLLDEIPTLTEFRIAPFVGVIPGDGRYRPSVEEIDEIIEVPVTHLLTLAGPRIEQHPVRGKLRDVYYYDYGKHVIWGATARILRDLLVVLGDLKTWNEDFAR